MFEFKVKPFYFQLSIYKNNFIKKILKKNSKESLLKFLTV